MKIPKCQTTKNILSCRGAAIEKVVVEDLRRDLRSGKKNKTEKEKE